MFRDPIRRFVEHVDASGVETVALEEPGMFHVFPILMLGQRQPAGLPSGGCLRGGTTGGGR
jgi:hypothetical protein